MTYENTSSQPFSSTIRHAFSAQGKDGFLESLVPPNSSPVLVTDRNTLEHLGRTYLIPGCTAEAREVLGLCPTLVGLKLFG